ncbi:MAG: alpha/beta fold hydrolase [Halioglobus sp.]
MLSRGAVFFLCLFQGTAGASESDCIVLLHGLVRSSGSMDLMATAMESEGYLVRNIDYPSTEGSIEQLADSTIALAYAACADAPRIHFVTHSMGGILLRQYLSLKPIGNLGRVVMLAPPNQGSELVDYLIDVPGFDFINGEAGAQLGTTEGSLPGKLGPVGFPLGIIAGTRSYNPFYSAIIPGPDDGKVSVASTQVEGMTDHIEVVASHTFMMNDDEVIRQTASFLRTGKFIRTEKQEDAVLQSAKN